MRPHTSSSSGRREGSTCSANNSDTQVAKVRIVVAVENAAQHLIGMLTMQPNSTLNPALMADKCLLHHITELAHL